MCIYVCKPACLELPIQGRGASLPNVVTLQGSQIELVSQYKYLGILIDDFKTFKIHTENVITKLFLF